MPNRDVYSNKPVTIRNFSGGWNVADSEHNLASKYQVVSDNIFVGVNGAIQPRYGYRLLHDLKQGTETSYEVNVTVTPTNSSPIIQITWPSAVPFSNGNHIRFPTAVVVAGLAAPLFGSYVVYNKSGSTFQIQARNNSTSGTAVTGVAISVIVDTHLLGGTILEKAYFQDHILVFSDTGEIIKISEANVATRIWDTVIAQALSGNPIGWRQGANEQPLTNISYDTWRQTLIVVNGRDNDKPIEIDLTRSPAVQFLVDPATASNTYVYPADFVQSFASYILMYASNNPNAGLNLTLTLVDLSAKNTSGVFTGNPSPDDATQIDLGRLTNTIDPLIKGVGIIRNQVFVGFYDSGMLGKVGIYNGAIHEPDFSDQIPQHGTLNNRVIVNIGNDLLMCDYAGVPAFALSQASGVIVPSRLSQLIDPELNRHLARLSPTTTSQKVFAVYNIRERQYMLSVPKFDENSAFTGVNNPFFASPEFEGTNNLVVNQPAHGLSENDWVDISGAVDIGPIAAADVNGRRRVVGAIDENYFIIEIGGLIPSEGFNGGGNVVQFAPVNDENIMYVFIYNQELRIRRWTRYRGLKFKASTVSKDGKIFFCTDSKIYRMGTGASPLYADAMEDYDERVWAAGKSYPVGHRVLDGTTVYVAQTAHVSAGASFAAARADNPLLWEVFTGYAIKWVAETPWSDYSDRMAVKVNSMMQFDVQDKGRFTFSVYVDNIYRDGLTLARTPAASVDFVGGNTGGFGSGAQSYGGGRRTKEQKIFNFPFRAKIAKLRMEGLSKEKLEINAISMMYQKGSVYR